MEERRLCVFTFILFISRLLMVSCTGQQNEEALTAGAREIHERILTVDTHCVIRLCGWSAVSGI